MPAVDNNRGSNHGLLQKQNGNISMLFCSTVIIFFKEEKILVGYLCLDVVQQEGAY